MSNLEKTKAKLRKRVSNKDAVDFMRMLSLYMLARWTSRLAESGKSVMVDANLSSPNGWGAWYLAEQAKRDRDEELERRERDYDYEQSEEGT